MKKTIILIVFLYSAIFSMDYSPSIYCDSAINGRLFALLSSVSSPADSSLRQEFFSYVITYSNLDSLIKSNKFYKIEIKNKNSAIIKSKNYKLLDSILILDGINQQQLKNINFISLYYKDNEKWYQKHIFEPTAMFFGAAIITSFFELFSVPFDHHFEWRSPLLVGSIAFTLMAIFTNNDNEIKNIQFKFP